MKVVLFITKKGICTLFRLITNYIWLKSESNLSLLLNVNITNCSLDRTNFDCTVFPSFARKKNLGATFYIFAIKFFNYGRGVR